MKKLGFIFILLIAFVISNAQISLTYSNHGFRPGDTHIMREASYVSEGSAGTNQIWDFSDLKCISTRTSVVMKNTQRLAKFSNSNFEVNESESNQFYNISENSLQYNGITTSDVILQYDVPIIKMKYPFTYGNSFDGVFSGSGTHNGASQINVKGTYNVVADGYGTLILPNNVIGNVLRVKSVTNTTEITLCSSYQIETTKYLWYSNDLRYPLLSISVVVEKSGNNPENIKRYVFYNEKVSDSNVANSVFSQSDNIENELNVYPNPFKSTINIDYKLVKDNNVRIEVYNNIGEKIAVIVDNQNQKSGNHSVSFDAKSISLNSGIYFVKYIIDNKSYIRKIIKTDN
jgi:hypothetical protein